MLLKANKVWLVLQRCAASSTQLPQQEPNMQLLNNWKLQRLSLHKHKPVPSDIAISRAQTPKPIGFLAAEMGLEKRDVTLYGDSKAKISLNALEHLRENGEGDYVVVTAITPTPFGEGKTTTLLGIVQAMAAHMGRNAIACIRQPSQGPTFGIKGGAAGGGYAQVIPMDEMNLHLTGDMHAVTAANNLLAAQLDARIYHERTQTDDKLFERLVPTKNELRFARKFSNIQLRRLKRLHIAELNPNALTSDEIRKFVRLNIDTSSISWQRVLDTNDRFLRSITIGQSPSEQNMSRQTSFAITAASEVMAVLALAKDVTDLKERLARIIVAFSESGEPVTADDLGATGAMAVLLRDAMQPNLMQTLEGTPVLVHAGPFANIAHGCSSVLADELALKLVGDGGFVLTEAGFGSDIGMEKFFNIKCRSTGRKPNAIVLVVTVRALKMHGSGPADAAAAYATENLDLLQKGLPNLLQHIANGQTYGLPVVVAINAHTNDTNAEHEMIINASKQAGAFAAVPSHHYAAGGSGALALAEAIIKACSSKSKFELLYPNNMPLFDKIQLIAQSMYGADKIQPSLQATHSLERLTKLGFNDMPICMAKTSHSLTGDATLKGAPKNFDLQVQDVTVAAGAGFVVAMCGEVSKMPGLPTRPAIYDIDLDATTLEVDGLF